MRYQQATRALGSRISRSEFARYQSLLDLHREHFMTKAPLVLASAPGRVELVGNHTDHNHGQVLAAAVNLDTAAVAGSREDTQVHLLSEGYKPLVLDLADLSPQPEEAGTTAALIRGVAAGLQQHGYAVGGFDAVMSSQVLSGSGLSSSAAFEVLVCFLFEEMYNEKPLDAIARAQISQYAENAYFMKPSGLMDQMASSCGGMVKIDFGLNPPSVETLQYSFSDKAYSMVVVNTRSSHDDLTPAYAAIPAEMKAAAGICGGTLLGDVPMETFVQNLPEIRRMAGDRAVLRGLHFYQENQRVLMAAKALKNDDLQLFFDVINASGVSSWTLLQNISVHEQEQPMALALAAAKQVLGSRGACRVHGGGFAGTTLNFVPQDLMDTFIAAMERLFGEGCCHTLDVRGEGPVRWV